MMMTAIALALAAAPASAEQPSGGHAQHEQQGQMNHGQMSHGQMMDHSRMDHDQMGHEGKDCCCKDKDGKGSDASRPATGSEQDGTGHEGHSGH